MTAKINEKMDPDTVVFWVHGADRLNFRGFPAFLETVEHEGGQEIRKLETRISSCNTKTVKGSTYWYEWKDGRHVYRGKEDPRPAYEAEIKKKKAALKGKLDLMKSCIIKQVGKDHLVIDLELYTKHVSKKPIGDQVNIGDMLRVRL